MIKKHTKQKILENKKIAQNTHLLKLTCGPDTIRFFQPGQFVHIKIPAAGEMTLRRPISIHYVDKDKREMELIYSVVGKGTQKLTEAREGQELDILAPLGNGFRLNDEQQNVWLCGGGTGVSALLSLVCKYPNKNYKAFLGFRSKDFMYHIERFEEFSEVYVTTDDGTYGERGFCTDVLGRLLKDEQPDVILACGPPMFYRSLKKQIGDTPALVSLEQRMGCGVGGCTTCVCKVNSEYKKICIEGPVFDIKEVDSING